MGDPWSQGKGEWSSVSRDGIRDSQRHRMAVHLRVTHFLLQGSDISWATHWAAGAAGEGQTCNRRPAFKFE